MGCGVMNRRPERSRRRAEMGGRKADMKSCFENRKSTDSDQCGRERQED